ncbi:hypothetical protein D9M71_111090 [compost metagenome]
MRYGAALDRLQILQTLDDPDQRHAERMRGRDGSQRVADVVLAQQVELDTRLSRQAKQGKADAATRIAIQVAGAEVGVRVLQAEAQDLVPSHSRLPDIESAIVAVKYGDAVGIQAFENLALGLDDLVLPTELAHMGRAGVGDDDDLRTGQAHGVGDLADTRGTQLDDRAAMLGSQLQQGQRRAQVVVQVTAGGQNFALGTQDAGQHLLHCGLAAGTRHCGDATAEGVAIDRAQLSEGQPGVVHHQLRQRCVSDFTFDQGCYCALGGHVGQIVVTIEARPGQGDEQLSGNNGAAVGADRIERRIGTRHAAIQRRSQVAQVQRLKHS